MTLTVLKTWFAKIKRIFFAAGSDGVGFDLVAAAAVGTTGSKVSHTKTDYSQHWTTNHHHRRRRRHGIKKIDF